MMTNAGPAVRHAPNPWRQFLRRGLTAALPRSLFMTSGPKGCGATCLTFDDGPHPEHTPRLLDVLARLGVRATFFVVGCRAERHPDLVRRIAEEGHELGNHSFSHAAPGSTAAGQLIAEVRKTSALLAELTGRAPALFRPPHGKVTAGEFWRLWWMGQTVVLWNMDPKDFACQSPEELHARLHETSLRGGEIVLLHDNLPHAAEALPGLVRAARRSGITFATISDWVEQ
jgi:peptidoglycan/xylan/chitin deacetylase (PgdA/CDA1 family)